MYIGLDIGTSGCKAAVMAADGRITATASETYSLITPRPGWVELNPETVWQSVVAVLSALAPAAADVHALAVSSIGESVVLLDNADTLLYNAITYVDNRCDQEVRDIAAAIPERDLHDLTGMPLNQMYTLPKLLWLRRHQPEVFARVAKAMMFAEYFGYRLTGNRLADPASAARTLFFDARRLDWSTDLLRQFGVDRSLFADIAPFGSEVGTILSDIAAATGLPAGLRVYLGGHDQPICTLGSGALTPGATLLTEGSSESLNMVLARENLTAMLLDNQVAFEPFVEDRYFGNMGQLTHGHAVHWFLQLHRRDILAARRDDGESVYDIAERLVAADSEPVYCLPQFAGVDVHDSTSDAKGCFLGLDVGTDIWRLYRALLEGLAFETRIHMEQMARTGAVPTAIAASGGGSRSRAFMQLKADVLRRPIHILESNEAGIMGLGMICAVASGTYADYAAAGNAFVRIRDTLTPSRDYEAHYRRYLAVRDSLKTLYRNLRNV